MREAQVLPARGLVGALAALALAACSGPVTTPRDLPSGGAADYQLGGDSEPAPGVDVVVRDAEVGEPLQRPGAYSVCYVNAFQTQPGRAGEWPADLVLTDLGEDPDWPGELLVDLSTPRSRERAADHLQPLLETCAAKGFDAVELDNLDSWTRLPDVPFGQEEAVEAAALLAERAHALGLAVAQKNTPQLTREESRDAVGFDLAVAEECGRYDECDAYTALFGDDVVAVEYTGEGLAAACEALGGDALVVLRDRDLAPAGTPGHVERRCPGGVTAPGPSGSR